MYLMLVTAFAFAQEDKVFTPEAGDIAIGFDAVPVFNLALNAVNLLNNTGQDANGLIDYPAGFGSTLFGKYFLSDSQAVRIFISPNITSSSEATDYDNPLQVNDPDVDPDDVGKISDITNSNSHDILLGGGYEMRRGDGRIQGVYGGDLFFGHARSSSTAVYGYAYNDDAFELGVITDGSSRVLNSKSGATVSFGLRGFLGLEYFIIPKMSVRAEYGLGFTRSKTNRGTIEEQTWTVTDDEGSSSIDSDTTGSTTGAFIFDVDNGADNRFSGSNASLLLTVHF
jgi:hypothetical protein